MKSIKITIITATYNSEKTLEQTISSVVNQDYDNIEYIIIDGASTDNTIGIIKKYNNYNIKWISEPDNGLYDAFNKGVSMATGDYVQFLGSDDSLCNDHIISKVVEHLEDDLDVLSCGIYVVDENSGKQQYFGNDIAKNRDEYLGGMIPHQGMFVKTSLVRRLKFDTSYRIAADYKLFLQCYFDGNINIKYVDDAVVFFSNAGCSSNSEKELDIENNRIYKELDLLFKSPVTHGTSKTKKIVKKILWKIGLYYSIKKSMMPLVDYVNKNKWQDHKCKNKICRWCGRE